MHGSTSRPKQPKSVGLLEATTGAVQPDNKTTNFFLPCGLPAPEGDRTYPLRGHGAAPTSPPGGVLRHDCLPLQGLWARLTGTAMGRTGKPGTSTTQSTRHHFCYGPYSATDRRHRTGLGLGRERAAERHGRPPAPGPTGPGLWVGRGTYASLHLPEGTQAAGTRVVLG
jgi:hypothetical protein